MCFSLIFLLLEPFLSIAALIPALSGTSRLTGIADEASAVGF
jgi:hypothetical protein